MAFIQPSSRLVLLSGYGGDKTYNHTRYFNSKTQQQNYFLSLNKLELTNLSYVNYTQNTVRVKFDMSQVGKYNYMMFLNDKFENKWFYAFIDSVKQVNNNLCEVEFTIDLIQSYWFDFDIHPCFVEREHTYTDNIGDNITEEGLELGEYVCYFEDILRLNGEHIHDGVSMHGFQYMVIATQGFTYGAGGSITWSERYTSVNGVLVPFSYMYAWSENDLVKILSVYAREQKVDAIVTIITCRNYQESTPFHTETRSYSFGTEANAFGGYRPKNNKLYIYPYSFLEVDNGSGGSGVFKRELFKNKNTASFSLVSAFITDSCSILAPKDYRGLDVDYNSGIVFNDYPVLPFTKDVYSTWVGMNRNQVNASVLNSIIASQWSPLTSFIGSSNMIGAVKNTANAGISSAVSLGAQVRSINAKMKDLSSFPPQATSHTTISPINICADVDRFGFAVRFMSITQQYARIIDDYFNMFGYAINLVKVPNIKAADRATQQSTRPYWEYIKTNGCSVEKIDNAFLSNEDARLIENIFDKGITFWLQSYEKMCDYSLNNKPITSVG